MAKNNKVRTIYENLFKSLVRTTKGNQKIGAFISQIKKTIDPLMLPVKLSEVRLSIGAAKVVKKSGGKGRKVK